MFSNLLLKPGLAMKALAFVFFSVAGLGTLSAQYQDAPTALETLKGEITTLEIQESVDGLNANTLSTILFKKQYFFQVFNSIEDGNSIDHAIHNDLPTAKPNMNTSFQHGTDDPNFRNELAALVTYTEDLLAE